MSTFTVTNTNSSGEGSLAWAVEQANVYDGFCQIFFDESLRGLDFRIESDWELINTDAQLVAQNGVKIINEYFKTSIYGSFIVDAAVFGCLNVEVISGSLILQYMEDDSVYSGAASITLSNSATLGISSEVLNVSEIYVNGSSAMMMNSTILGVGLLIMSDGSRLEMSDSTISCQGLVMSNDSVAGLTNSTVTAYSSQIGDSGTFTMSGGALLVEEGLDIQPGASVELINVDCQQSSISSMGRLTLEGCRGIQSLSISTDSDNSITNNDFSETTIVITGDGVVDLSGNDWGTEDMDEIISKIEGYDASKVIISDFGTEEPDITSFTVTNTNSSGEGSLAWAVAQANAYEGACRIVMDESIEGQQITISGNLTLSNAEATLVMAEGVQLNMGSYNLYLYGTLQAHYETRATAFSASAGDIYVYDGASLDVSNADFYCSNKGYSCFYVSSGGTVTISDSEIGYLLSGDRGSLFDVNNVHISTYIKAYGDLVINNTVLDGKIVFSGDSTLTGAGNSFGGSFTLDYWSGDVGRLFPCFEASTFTSSNPRIRLCGLTAGDVYIPVLPDCVNTVYEMAIFDIRTGTTVTVEEGVQAELVSSLQIHGTMIANFEEVCDFIVDSASNAYINVYDTLNLTNANITLPSSNGKVQVYDGGEFSMTGGTLDCTSNMVAYAGSEVVMTDVTIRNASINASGHVVLNHSVIESTDTINAYAGSTLELDSTTSNADIVSNGVLILNETILNGSLSAGESVTMNNCTINGGFSLSSGTVMDGTGNTFNGDIITLDDWSGSVDRMIEFVEANNFTAETLTMKVTGSTTGDVTLNALPDRFNPVYDAAFTVSTGTTTSIEEGVGLKLTSSLNVNGTLVAEFDEAVDFITESAANSKLIVNGSASLSNTNIQLTGAGSKIEVQDGGQLSLSNASLFSYSYTFVAHGGTLILNNVTTENAYLFNEGDLEITDSSLEFPFGNKSTGVALINNSSIKGSIDNAGALTINDSTVNGTLYIDGNSTWEGTGNTFTSGYLILKNWNGDTSRFFDFVNDNNFTSAYLGFQLQGTSTGDITIQAAPDNFRDYYLLSNFDLAAGHTANLEECAQLSLGNNASIHGTLNALFETDSDFIVSSTDSDILNIYGTVNLSHANINMNGTDSAIRIHDGGSLNSTDSTISSIITLTGDAALTGSNNTFVNEQVLHLDDFSGDADLVFAAIGALSSENAYIALSGSMGSMTLGTLGDDIQLAYKLVDDATISGGEILVMEQGNTLELDTNNLTINGAFVANFEQQAVALSSTSGDVNITGSGAMTLTNANLDVHALAVGSDACLTADGGVISGALTISGTAQLTDCDLDRSTITCGSGAVLAMSNSTNIQALSLDYAAESISISNCNLVGTTIDFTGSGDCVIDLSGNYWGTTDIDAIYDMLGIFDRSKVIINTTASYPTDEIFTYSSAIVQNMHLYEDTTTLTITLNHTVDASSVGGAISLMDADGQQVNIQSVEVDGTSITIVTDSLDKGLYTLDIAEQLLDVDGKSFSTTDGFESGLVLDVYTTEYLVTNTDTSGEGSLYSALSQANAYDGQCRVIFDETLKGETIYIDNTLTLSNTEATLVASEGICLNMGVYDFSIYGTVKADFETTQDFIVSSSSSCYVKVYGTMDLNNANIGLNGSNSQVEVYSGGSFRMSGGSYDSTLALEVLTGGTASLIDVVVGSDIDNKGTLVLNGASLSATLKCYGELVANDSTIAGTWYLGGSSSFEGAGNTIFSNAIVLEAWAGSTARVFEFLADSTIVSDSTYIRLYNTTSGDITLVAIPDYLSDTYSASSFSIKAGTTTTVEEGAKMALATDMNVYGTLNATFESKQDFIVSSTNSDDLYVRDGGTVNLKNANVTLDGSGSQVYIYSGGSFNMEGGSYVSSSAFDINAGGAANLIDVVVGSDIDNDGSLILNGASLSATLKCYGELVANDSTIAGTWYLGGSSSFEGAGNTISSNAIVLEAWAGSTARVFEFLADSTIVSDSTYIRLYNTTSGDITLVAIPDYLSDTYSASSFSIKAGTTTTVEEGAKIALAYHMNVYGTLNALFESEQDFIVSSTSSDYLYVRDGGTVNLKNANVTLDGSGSHVYIFSGGSFNMEGGAYASSSDLYIYSGGAVDLNDVEVSTNIDNDGSLVLTSGSVSGSVTSGSTSNSAASLTIDGATLGSFLSSYGSLSINNSTLASTLVLGGNSSWEGTGNTFNGSVITLEVWNGSTSRVFDFLADNTLTAENPYIRLYGTTTGDMTIALLPDYLSDTYSASSFSIKSGTTTTVEEGAKMALANDMNVYGTLNALFESEQDFIVSSTSSDDLCVRDGGTVNLKNANVTLDASGSHVYIFSGGSFNMEGGAYASSSDLYIYSGGAADLNDVEVSTNIDNYGSLVLTSGSVSGAVTSGSSSNSTASLTIDGATLGSSLSSYGSLSINNSTLASTLVLGGNSSWEGTGNTFNGSVITLSAWNGSTSRVFDFLADNTLTAENPYIRLYGTTTGDMTIALLPDYLSDTYSASSFSIKSGTTTTVEEGAKMALATDMHVYGTLNAIFESEQDFIVSSTSSDYLYVRDGGTVNLKNANVTLDGSGSHVYIYSGGSFNMEGGSYNSYSAFYIGSGSAGGTANLRNVDFNNTGITSVYDSSLSLVDCVNVGNLSIDTDGDLTITGNDFENSTITLSGSGVVDLSGNYWGTIYLEEIITKIKGYDADRVILNDWLLVSPEVDFAVADLESSQSLYGVGTDSLTLVFSQMVDMSTVNNDTLYLMDEAGNKIEITAYTQEDNKVTLHFDELSLSGQYTLYAGTDITNIAGDYLLHDEGLGGDIAFNTSIVVDVDRESITSVVLQSGISPDFVQLTLSDVIDASTVSLESFTITNPAGEVLNIDSYTITDDKTIRLYSTQLTELGEYTITIANGISDAAGNELQNDTQEFNVNSSDLVIKANDTHYECTDTSGIDIALQVQNMGNVSGSGYLNVSIYLSLNGEIDDNAIYVDGFSSWNGVAAGSSADYSRYLDVAKLGESLALGDYQIVAKVGNSYEHESQRDNNTCILGSLSVIETPSTDLSVWSLQSPTQVIPGNDMSLSGSILSGGTLDVTGLSCLIGVKLVSGDSVYDLGEYSSTLTANGDMLGCYDFELSGISIPKDIAISGDYQVQITLNTDESIYELEGAPDNNVYTATTETNVAAMLSLQSNISTVTEGNSITYTLTRSGDASEALSVQLGSSEAARLNLPDSVTFAAGEREMSFSVSVEDDDLYQGLINTQITASADGFIMGELNQSIQDDEVPAITLILDEKSIIEGNDGTGTIQLNTIVTEDTVVKLGSMSSRIDLPSTVTILAGQRESSFSYHFKEDTAANIDKDITITAKSDGYSSDSSKLTLVDNDIPSVSLKIDRTLVSEGAGYYAFYATLVRTDGSDQAITIKLEDADNIGLILPSSVVMEEGVKEVSFQIGVVDNGTVDGDRTGSIVGTIILNDCGCSTASSALAGAIKTDVTIIDNDGPSLSVELSTQSIRENTDSVEITIRSNYVSNQDVVIYLSDSANSLTLPESVILRAGEREVTVTANAISDGLTTGTRLVHLSAQSDGYTQASGYLNVTDIDLPDLIVDSVELSGDAIAGKESTVTVSISNIGFVATSSPITVQLTLSSGEVLGSYVVNDIINAGDKVTFDYSVTMPSKSGEMYIETTVDALNAQTEISITNNSARSNTFDLSSGYSVALELSQSMVVANSQIQIKGQISSYLEGMNYEGETVTLQIKTNAGTLSPINVQTDQYGQFSTYYTIPSGISGTYSISAGIHDDLTADIAQFEVLGITLETSYADRTWDLTLGESYSGEIVFTNTSNVDMKNVMLVCSSLPSNVQIDVTGYDELLEVGESFTAHYEIIGSFADYGKSFNTINFEVMSDGDVVDDFKTYSYVNKPEAELSLSIRSIDRDIYNQSKEYIELTITNTGKDDSGKITINPPDLAWLSVYSGLTIDNLAAGESAVVTLMVDGSKDELVLNYDYTGKISIKAENADTELLDFNFSFNESETSNLHVSVIDLYASAVESNVYLDGAVVMLRNAYTYEIIATATTDENGCVDFTNIAAGDYELQTQFSNYDSKTELIHVSAGKELDKSVYLTYNAVSYEFVVEKSEITDEYTITQTTTFVTEVPVPVITVTEQLIIPNLEEDDSAILSLVISNYGLIAAQDMQILLPSIDGYTLTVLNPIDELAALSSETIYIQVKLDESSDDKSASTGDFVGSLFQCFFGSGFVVSNFPCVNAAGQMISNDFIITGEGCDIQLPDIFKDWFKPGDDDGGEKAPGKEEEEEEDPRTPGPITTLDTNCDPCQSALKKEQLDALCSAIIPAPKIYDVKKTADQYNESFKYFQEVGLIPGMYENNNDIMDKLDEEHALEMAKTIGKETINAVIDNNEIWKKTKKYTGYAVDAATTLMINLNACNDHESPLDFLANFSGTGEDLLRELGLESVAVSPWVMEAADSIAEVLSYCQQLKGYAQTLDIMKTYLLAYFDGADNDQQISGSSSTFSLAANSIDSLAEEQDEIAVMTEADFDSWLNLFANVTDGDTCESMLISDEEMAELMSHTYVVNAPDAVVFIEYCERWNNTIQNYSEGKFSITNVTEGDSTDFISLELFNDTLIASDEILNLMTNNGEIALEDVEDEALSGLRDLNEYDASEGICATVKLQFQQTALVTREAFTGTLTLENGTLNELSNINFRAKVTDIDGIDVTEHFSITYYGYDAFGNMVANDSSDGLISGTLAANTNGTIYVQYIPDSSIAATESENYYFGAELAYETATGNTSEVELTPVMLEVSPSANLSLHYFLQESIYSDDPFTSSVEATQQSEIGLIIVNNGAGAALDFTMSDFTPSYLENESGLALDLQMTGSSQNGESKQLTGTQLSFGDIDGESTSTAIWYFDTNIQGRFYDYEASFTRVNQWGDKKVVTSGTDVSLIEEVETHMLVRSMDIDGDSLYDFLVNDEGDVDNLADGIYLGNGEHANVNAVTSATSSGTLNAYNRSIILTVELEVGYNYIQLKDFGQGVYALESITSNGLELNETSYWQTDRSITIEGTSDYSNLLHYVYYVEESTTQDFTLTYVSVDKVAPTVISLAGIDNKSTMTSMPANVEITFSKEIEQSSFSIDAITLRAQSQPVDLSGLTWSWVDDCTVRLNNLADFVNQDALYSLTVTTEGVVDIYGNQGAGSGLNTSWTMAAEAMAVKSLQGLDNRKGNELVSELFIEFTAAVSQFDIAALSIYTMRDGEFISIEDLSAISIQAVDYSNTLFVISGLNQLQSSDGEYYISIDSSLIESPNGTQGINQMTQSWALHREAPTVLSTSTGDSYILDKLFTIQFSHEVSTISDSAVKLMIDDVDTSDYQITTSIDPNDASIVIVQLSALEDTGLKSGMIDESEQGTWTLDIDLSKVTDIYGNVGSEVYSTSWTVDSTAPDAIEQLHIIGSDNLSVATKNICINAQLPEAGLSVKIYERDINTTGVGTLIWSNTVNGDLLEADIDLTASGQRLLDIVTTDAAGNTTTSTFTIVVDIVALTCVSDLAETYRDLPDTAVLCFNSAITGLTLDNIQLRCNGNAIDISGLILSQTNDLTWQLSGLDALGLDSGAYELVVDLAALEKASSGLAGAGNYTASFYYDEVSSVELVSLNLEQSASGISEIAIVFSTEINFSNLSDEQLLPQAVRIINQTTGDVIELDAAGFSYSDAQLKWTGQLALLGGEYTVELDRQLITAANGTPLVGDAESAQQSVTSYGADATLISATMAGSYSAPYAVDYNGDGLVDLLIGEKTVDSEGKIRLYLNSGSPDGALYTTFAYLQSGGSDIAVDTSGCQGLTLSMHDLNGDGQLDLIAGTYDGKLISYMADGEGGFAEGGSMTASGAEINVASRAYPVFYDWNADGVDDLIIGNGSGELYVAIASQDESGSLSFATVSIIDGITVSGRAAPLFIDVNADGRQDLIVGDFDGQLNLYYRGESSYILVKTWSLDGVDWTRSRLTAADMNGDGITDVVVGGSTGAVYVIYGNQIDGALNKEFFIDSNATITATDLQVEGNQVILRWVTDGTLNGSSYRIQISSNADFRDAHIIETSERSSLQTNQADGMYFWRVQLVDEAGQSTAWTTGSSYIVDTTAPSVPTEATATQDEQNLHIEWNAVSDLSGVSYEIRYSSYADMSNATLLTSAGNSVTLADLTTGIWYYQIRSVDGVSLESDWTEIQSTLIEDMHGAGADTNAIWNQAIVLDESGAAISGYVDINKTGNGDSNMCWAAVSSNLIAAWQQYYSTSDYSESASTDAQSIYMTYLQNWDNTAGRESYGLTWWVFGESTSDSYNEFYSDHYTGGTDAGAYYNDSYDSSATGPFIEEVKLQGIAGATLATMWTDSFAGGQFMSVGIYKYRSTAGNLTGGHTLSLWGFEINDVTGLVSSVYVTDSDDSTTGLVKLDVTYNINAGFYQITDVSSKLNGYYLGDYTYLAAFEGKDITPPELTLNEAIITEGKGESMVVFSWVCDDSTAIIKLTINGSDYIATGDTLTLTLSDGQYDYTITATDPEGNSTLREASMTLDTRVTPDAPRNLSVLTVENNSKLSFDWSDVSDATSYTVEYSMNTDFSDAKSFTVSYSIGEVSMPELNGTYYWRVCAESADMLQSGWTEGESFLVDTLVDKLDEQSLSATVADSFVGTAITCSWDAASDISGIAKYILQYSASSDFSNAAEMHADGTSSTFYINQSANYYWRVAVVDKMGNVSNWTAAQSIINSTDDTVGETVASLSWQAVEGAGSYIIQYATDADFSDAVIIQSNQAGYDIHNISSDTSYYWKVVAIDESGQPMGTWSLADEFTTLVRVENDNVATTESELKLNVSSDNQLISASVTDYIGNDDAIDYYKVSTQEAANYSLILNTSDIDTPLYLTIGTLDAEGEYNVIDSVVTSANSASTGFTNLDLNANQDYYVRISALNGTNISYGGEYTLSMAADVVKDDRLSDNNELSTATKLETQSSDTDGFTGWVGAGDALDIYQMSMMEEGTLSIDLSNLDTMARVSVFEGSVDSSKLVYSGIARTSGLDKELDLSSGNYYIQIQSYDNGAGRFDTAYSLDIETVIDDEKQQAIITSL